MAKLKTQWQIDIPPLHNDSCEEVVGSQLSGVIAAGDKLIQLKYLHRIYYSPLRLYKMGK